MGVAQHTQHLRPRQARIERGRIERALDVTCWRWDVHASYAIDWLVSLEECV